jgi:hypothetical protein
MLQELHGIGGSVITRPDLRQEARRPCRAAKRPAKSREALEAEVTGRWRTLSNGFQAIKDLKTISATARVDSATAKTTTTIITHVKADLEGDTPQPPYLARQMSMDFVSQEHGVPRNGPKDSNEGG